MSSPKHLRKRALVSSSRAAETALKRYKNLRQGKGSLLERCFRCGSSSGGEEELQNMVEYSRLRVCQVCCDDLFLKKDLLRCPGCKLPGRHAQDFVECCTLCGTGMAKEGAASSDSNEHDLFCCHCCETRFDPPHKVRYCETCDSDVCDACWADSHEDGCQNGEEESNYGSSCASEESEEEQESVDLDALLEEENEEERLRHPAVIKDDEEDEEEEEEAQERQQDEINEFDVLADLDAAEAAATAASDAAAADKGCPCLLYDPVDELDRLLDLEAAEEAAKM